MLQLVAEGYLVGQQGRGDQVIAFVPDQCVQANTVISETAPQAEITLFDYSIRAKTGPATGALQTGVPDLSAFPFRMWQKLTQRYSGRAVLAGMADAMGY